MDVLSSMATIAGYRAVLLAAVELPKIFPLLMTAAGTLTRSQGVRRSARASPACRRLPRPNDSVRSCAAYDVRPACREQVESLGGKFVEIAARNGGRRRQQAAMPGAQDEAFYRRQRELLAQVVAESDVVITTAAIPGKQSPLLVTAEAVARMQPGSVIVDLAAERGGNCALTKADQRVVTENGVTILGPTNLPSEVPHARQPDVLRQRDELPAEPGQEGRSRAELDDEIIRETLAAEGGQVGHMAASGNCSGLPKLPEPAPIET